MNLTHILTAGSLALWACEPGDSSPALTYAQARARADQEPPVVLREQVTLGELVFDVRTAGPEDGELVILLHGFPESSYEWREQISTLAAAGYHVVAPDQRGYSPGARPTEIDRYALTEFVGDVTKLADAYDAFRFHLVGHDVGALVAWGTAQLSGLRLKSLTVLSVAHPGAFAAQLSDPESCQAHASAWYVDLLPANAASALLDDPDSLLQQAWAELEPDAVADYQRLLGTPALLDGALNLWRANFKGGQPQGAYPIPITVPTLYVWGDQDPYSCRDGEPLSRLLTWAPYRFEVLTGIGHWIPETAAEQFDPLLLSHLRANRF